MKIISGLITKDLLQLKSYRKTLIIFILIFVFTGIEQETTKGVGVMIAVMLTFGFGMFGMATFNYDEQSKTDRYILTFNIKVYSYNKFNYYRGDSRNNCKFLDSIYN